MAAQQWRNDGGTARRMVEKWRNDNGVARRIRERWINDNGTARLVFVGDVLLLAAFSGDHSAVAPADATARLRFGADGNQYQGNTLQNIGPYITPQASAANYSVRATVTAGDPLTTGTTGAWLALSSDPTWTLTFTGNNGQFQSTILFEFALSTDLGTIIYAPSYVMTAFVSP